MREQHIFRKIPIREFLKQAWTKTDDDTKAPELKKMIDQFNEVSSWIQTEIVSQTDVKNRAIIIEKFIEILDVPFLISPFQELYKLHNYQTMFEFVGGLSAASLSRLKKTWAVRLYPDGQKVSKTSETRLQELTDIASPIGNYKGLRAHAQKVLLLLTIGARHGRGCPTVHWNVPW